jgi:DnaJ-domain-containing protein 1
LKLLVGFDEYLPGIDLFRLKGFLQQEKANGPLFESLLLREFCPELDLVNGPAIELYRWHFVLFHQLYRLKDLLVPENQYLHIHFMGIHLLDFPEFGWCRHYSADLQGFCGAQIHGTADSLCEFHRNLSEENSLAELSERYFYLDSANFSALREEDAEGFISGAWNLLGNHQAVEEAYRTMGMPINSDLKLVKLHFRKLAKELHPDLHPEQKNEFSKINSAYRCLINYLSLRSFK